jgi:phosphohistidine swiveling domain-containing protein
MKNIYLHHESLDENTFGSKFSNISLLAKKGIRVPEFFCLSPKVFRDIFKNISIDVGEIVNEIDWEDQTDVLLKSQKIKDLFLTQELSISLYKEIEDIFDSHLGLDSIVSVRSCVRSDNIELKEDSADNAFAGMSESIMFLQKSDLKKAILTCFSSCYSQQVLIYRNKLKIPQFGMEVVVGIQRMIRGQESFIMFSKDPMDFKNQTVITCGHGTGEGIVQGKVETDHYLIDNSSGQIEKKIIPKLLKMDIDHESKKGIRIYDVELSLQNISCLTDEKIVKLWEVGKHIESIQQYPQDIEGCFDEFGNLYILQSRPIVIDKENLTVWSSLNVSESYPDISTPLTFSFAQNFYKTIFYDCYYMFGVSRKTLLENEHALSNMLGYLNGRIHYNIGNFYRLHGLSPLFPLFRKSWEEMIGLSMGYLIISENNKSDRFLSLFKGAFFTPVLLVKHLHNFSKFYTWWRKLFNRSQKEILLVHENPLKLYRIFLHIWKEVESNWGVTLVNDVFMGVTQTVLMKLISSSKKISDKKDEVLSDLLCGGENPISVDAMYSSLSIVKLINENDFYRKVFINNSSVSIWNEIQTNNQLAELKAVCHKHLELYGYRGLQELKLENDPPKNRPEYLIELLQGQLSNAAYFSDMKSEDEVRRKKIEIYLKENLGTFSIKRKLMIVLSNFLRKLVVQRENSRYCRSELFGISREIYKYIATCFVRDGIIESESDIFFCTFNEIQEMILGTGANDKLIEIVKIRKIEFQKNNDEFGKQTFSTVGPIYNKQFPFKEEFIYDESALRGLGSSNGIVTGKVRIVINPDPSIKLYPDEILVAKETDPGWLFLMVSAKGMVVERGSMLSHTAITGRKLGVPTVVSVPNATSILKDGDIITINGSSGIITIEKRA